MPFREFYEGQLHRVVAYVARDGRCPVDDFLEGLNERSRIKMLARIRRAGDHGPPHNPEQNKSVTGRRYFEFKTSGYRVFWRWSRDNEIILMHGFPKRTDRIPKAELAAGDRIFQELEDELK